MNLVKIQYVGLKPMANDNVARSGKVWEGEGDIQEVTAAQAKILIKYPDQWRLADEDDRELVEMPIPLKVVDEDGDTVLINPEDLIKPLEHMSKTELKAFAKARWGRDMDTRWSSKRMIDQIEEWELELDQVNGAPAVE